jgi:hypothetical protein
MSMTFRRVLAAAVLTLGASVARPLHAQDAAAVTQQRGTDSGRTDTTCVYERCALGIAPRWNGLEVVRGASGAPLANLHFFWPHDISTTVAGPDLHVRGADSAAAAARHAVRLRRLGAAFIDGGAIVLAGAAVAALTAGKARRGDQQVASAGAAMIVISVPFQFAADGALSRAVWWHNARYTSSAPGVR